MEPGYKPPTSAICIPRTSQLRRAGGTKALIQLLGAFNFQKILYKTH